MKMKYCTVKKAAEEIFRLQKLLGIADNGQRYLNIREANKRIAELEAMLAEKQAAPVAPVAVAAVPVKAAAPPLPTLSRQRCIAIARDVFGEAVMAGPLTDAELIEDTLAKIQAERLALPGSPKPDCSDLGIRGKAFREMKQDRLDYVLRTVE